MQCDDAWSLPISRLGTSSLLRECFDSPGGFRKAHGWIRLRPPECPPPVVTSIQCAGPCAADGAPDAGATVRPCAEGRRASSSRRAADGHLAAGANPSSDGLPREVRSAGGPGIRRTCTVDSPRAGRHRRLRGERKGPARPASAPSPRPARSEYLPSPPGTNPRVRPRVAFRAPLRLVTAPSRALRALPRPVL